MPEDAYLLFSLRYFRIRLSTTSCAAKGRQVPSKSSLMGWYHRDQLIHFGTRREMVKAVTTVDTVSLPVSLSWKSQEVNEYK